MIVKKPTPGLVEDLFVRVDGRRVHYQRAGSGRPLLLIHGLIGSARNWSRNIEELSKHASVYAIDLLNMGESERVSGADAGLDTTADFIERWMDTVGLFSADVAGHSHGGAVAMTLAIRHPDRVGKLILFAPANPYCNLGRQLISFYKTRPGRWVANLIPSLPQFVKATALGRMYGDPSRATREALEGYTYGLRTPGSVEHVLQIVKRWNADMGELKAALHQLAGTPVLFVWGDRDRAVSLSSAKRLHQLLPYSQLLVVPGAGHIAFEEMPEICNQVMSEWLASPPQLLPTFNMRYPTHPLQRLEAV